MISPIARDPLAEDTLAPRGGSAPEEEGSAWVWLALLPVGFLTLTGLGLVLIGLFVVSSATSRIDAAQTQADRSREQLYAVLEAEHAVIDQLARAGADRAKVEHAYASLTQPRAEPARIQAANQLVEFLVAEAAHRSDPGSANDGAIGRIKDARDVWVERSEAWELAADTLSGRLVVSVGLAPTPP
jgi:hypothetical protein